mmetsp:Transcript_20639/g.57503  ORF Transcript_20639/g.57503 Transcript_20639/m.57503 type:complete len:233 (-) Transcript_20639:537-1235(-)
MGRSLIDQGSALDKLVVFWRWCRLGPRRRRGRLCCGSWSRRRRVPLIPELLDVFLVPRVVAQLFLVILGAVRSLRRAEMRPIVLDVLVAQKASQPTFFGVVLIRHPCKVGQLRRGVVLRLLRLIPPPEPLLVLIGLDVQGIEDLVAWHTTNKPIRRALLPRFQSVSSSRGCRGRWWRRHGGTLGLRRRVDWQSSRRQIREIRQLFPVPFRIDVRIEGMGRQMLVAVRAVELA